MDRDDNYESPHINIDDNNDEYEKNLEDEMEKTTNGSDFVDTTMRNWLKDIPMEQRKDVIDAIYSLIMTPVTINPIIKILIDRIIIIFLFFIVYLLDF